MMSITEYLLRDYASTSNVGLVDLHQMALDINRVGQHAYTREDTFTGYFMDNAPLGRVEPEVGENSVSIDKACVALVAFFKARAKNKVNEKLFQYVTVNLHQARLIGHAAGNLAHLIGERHKIIFTFGEKRVDIFSMPGRENKIRCVSTIRVKSCVEEKEYTTFDDHFITLKSTYNITYCPYDNTYLISLDIKVETPHGVTVKIQKLIALINNFLSQQITISEIKTFKNEDAEKIIYLHKYAAINWDTREPRLHLKSGISLQINEKVSVYFRGWTQGEISARPHIAVVMSLRTMDLIEFRRLYAELADELVPIYFWVVYTQERRPQTNIPELTKDQPKICYIDYTNSRIGALSDQPFNPEWETPKWQAQHRYNEAEVSSFKNDRILQTLFKEATSFTASMAATIIYPDGHVSDIVSRTQYNLMAFIEDIKQMEQEIGRSELTSPGYNFRDPIN